MKVLPLIICLTFYFSPVFGQSFLKTSTNMSRFYAGFFYPQDARKLGLGLGHEMYFLNRKNIKIIFGDGIDYRHREFSYDTGGLGTGTYNNGDAHFVSVTLDLRLRVGRKLFAEMGTFTSYAFSKIFKNEKTVRWQACFLPSTPCPSPRTIPFEDRFSRYDYGLIMGAGYIFEKAIWVLNYQLGACPILDIGGGTSLASSQFILSCAIPFAILKKKNNEK